LNPKNLKGKVKRGLEIASKLEPFLWLNLQVSKEGKSGVKERGGGEFSVWGG
jgi:hypothetical protein